MKSRSLKNRKSRGGSMVGRLAVPAGLLLLQKMMHAKTNKNKKNKKLSKKYKPSRKVNKSMRRKRK